MFTAGWKKTERGSATIEAIVAFTGFLFTIFTILNVANYCRAQMLISNAVDTAARELSQYSYFYEMSGLGKLSKEISANAENGAANLNDIIGTVDTLYQSIESAKDNTVQNVTNAANALEDNSLQVEDVQSVLVNLEADTSNVSNSITSVFNALEKVQNDPILYMRSIVAVAGNDAVDLLKSHVIAAPLAKLFTAKHFGDTLSEASQKLESLGVVDGLDGMNFNMSTVFASGSPDDVHLVVYYKLKLVSLFKWAELEATVCKEAVTKGWLGGDDADAIVKVAKTDTESGTETTETVTGGETTEQTENTPEVTPESTEPTTETEESEEEATETPFDYANSYWAAMTQEETLSKLREDFLKGHNIVQYAGTTNLVGMDSSGTVYGITTIQSADEAYGLAEELLNQFWESLNAENEQYIETNGASGISADEAKSYQVIIYIPENMSEELLKEIRKRVTEYMVTHEGQSPGKNVEYDYVRAGGDNLYG